MKYDLEHQRHNERTISVERTRFGVFPSLRRESFLHCKQKTAGENENLGLHMMTGNV